MSSNKKNNVMTFDIWDTLIKRNCHPEEIKLYTANNILYNYNKYLKDKDIISKDIYLRRLDIEEEEYDRNSSLGNDPECNIYDVLKKLVHEFLDTSVLKSNNISLDELVAKLVSDEIQREIDVTYVNGDIQKYLKQGKENNIPMYCISDFYIGKEGMAKILEERGLLHYFKDIYISCDYMKTKRNNGNLFDLFMEKEDLSPENITHYGDNIYSDVQMAKSKGITAIRINNNSCYTFDIDKFNVDLRLDNVLREVREDGEGDKEDKRIYGTVESLKKRADELYNLGVMLSPISYYYIYDVILDAHMKGYSRMFYQTREGENFIKYHHIMEENNVLPFDIPSAELLHVSRVATFFPSLTKLDVSNMLRLWSQYRAQSMDAMFVSLGLDTKKYEKYFKKYDIDPEVTIYEPHFNTKVISLFNDDDFQKEINEELNIRKKNIYKYFENRGITNTEGDRMYIVDIGWRGTIQDNLSYLLDNTFLDGGYITLFDYYNYQRKNTRKHAFLDDKEFAYKYIDPVITILEMLFNSESGSVISYDENGKEIRKAKKEESEYVTHVVSNIQAGMMHGARQINLRMKTRSITKEQAKHYIEDIIRGMKENPSKLLVEVYYGLVHNDTFGTGKYLKKRALLSTLDKMRPFKVRDMIRNSLWKESFYIANNLKLYPMIISLKQKIRNMLGK